MFFVSSWGRAMFRPALDLFPMPPALDVGSAQQTLTMVALDCVAAITSLFFFSCFHFSFVMTRNVSFLLLVLLCFGFWWFVTGVQVMDCSW